jgi:hypothetical protein
MGADDTNPLEVPLEAFVLAPSDDTVTVGSS